ncbi:MAG: hypothetical protein ACTSRZ_13140, partial [Promethearchaeota archaeon]
MAFDDLFIQLWKEKFSKAIQSHCSVGVLEKSFDLLIQGNNQLIQNSNLPSPFKVNAIHICEFKSTHDYYDSSNFLKLIGDASYFSFNKKYTLVEFKNSIRIWMIVAQSNNYFDELLTKGEIKNEPLKGFYKLDILDNFNIIVIDHLEINESNMPFLVMASKPKLKEFVQSIIKDKIQLDSITKKYLRTRFYID